jgi:hypothetical protein
MMDMPFDNRMTNMQTPGRLQALCKLLLLGTYSIERIRELLQPNSLDKIQANEVIRMARNGGLIQENKDKLFQLNIPEQEVRDNSRFEAYLAKNVFYNKDFIFGRFSAWVMTRSEKVMNETREELSERFFNEVTRKTRSTNEFNKENITAWMTWANYFGLGHTMDSKFVGNPSKRIQRVLANDQELPKGEYVPFRQFMRWLGDNCPELDGGKLNHEFNELFSSQQLSFALSLGLRTLHDLGVVNMKVTRDVEDIWYLQEVPAHDIRNQVTDIMVKG